MSSPSSSYDLREIATQFDVRGDFVFAEPYGSGHINDTFCAVYDQGACRVRYILQRVNHNIFKNTAGLMENVARICRHSLSTLQKQGVRDASRRTLTLIPTRDGGDWYVDPDKNFWRCYIFVERARGYDVVETTEQAFQAAQAFGNFTKLLVDIPGGRLVDTIPNFHNTRWRFENFQKALEADSQGRAKDVAVEVDFLLKREKDCAIVVDAMEKGDIPERVTHNDTKLNNVLIDDYTQTGICVIDLDTSMPGSALYDFGDMVRTATAPTKEDETDLSKVVCRAEYFEALVRGYMTSLGGTLNKTEKELLPFGGKLMTMEVGMRFLTDYLEGDVYFKTKHATHNLERCRNQFALVASIEAQLDTMNKLVASL